METIKIFRSSSARLALLAGALLAGGGMFSRAADVASNPPPNMVLIPAGVYRPTFRALTEPKEIPVKTFYLDVVPVTTREYLEFVRANPRWQRSQVKRIFADVSYLKS